jgi:hypothetical protein
MEISARKDYPEEKAGISRIPTKEETKDPEGEREESSPSIQRSEWCNKRYPSGSEPPPEPGTPEWVKRKEIEWRNQALDVMGLRVRLTRSEKYWQEEERAMRILWDTFRRKLMATRRAERDPGQQEGNSKDDQGQSGV